jgi:hypothetical protein
VPDANSAPAAARSPHHAPLNAWDRLGLFLFFLVIVGFGIHVEIRSAFLKRHQTDLGVYLRAGWAVRAGEDIYDITDENDWHYQYPPLFAILMTPFADPPPGADRTGYLPFAATSALWYVLNIGLLFFALHCLATILEADATDPAVRSLPTGCRRWWQLRALPLLICLIPTGQTLIRGQVSLVLLALLAGFVAALYRRQDARAGFWLSAAICLKVIPAFLLILPLWQRNVRCLVGCVAGVLVGLILIPAAVFGPARTIEYYREYDTKVLRPGMGKEGDQARAEELTRVTSTDSQSIVAMIHNTMHRDRATRPLDATQTVRRVHWIIGGLLTLLTLLAAGFKPLTRATALVLLLGALTFNMLASSPVCHLHYYCLSMPMVMGLMAYAWERGGLPRLTAPVVCLFTLNVISGLIPVLAQEIDGLVTRMIEAGGPAWLHHLPAFVLSRDLGMATYGAALLWLATCSVIRRAERPQATESPQISTQPIAAEAAA